MIGVRSTPHDGVPYISRLDEALDQKHRDHSLEHYLSTWDRKHQPIAEGKTPTTFWLRRLTRRQTAVIDAAPASERAQLAVAYGLERVDNFRLANGEMLRVEHVDEGEAKRLSKDTLDQMFSDALFVELSMIIRALGGLDPLAARR